MRKIMSLIVVAACMIVFASDTIVIVKRDGKTIAINTDDIDSIRLDDSENIDAGCFNFMDTIVQKDTLVVTKKVYETVCVSDAGDEYVNIENPVAARFLNEVDYTNTDYSYTKIEEYSNIATDYRKDQPRGIQITWPSAGSNQHIILSKLRNFATAIDTIDVDDNATSHVLFNLLPNETYYYRVISGENILKTGHFSTIGHIRMMYIPSLYNVRDLGGWPTEDGHRLRYGRIFRGGEMNDYYNIATLGGISHTITSQDSMYMHDDLNIRLDMDLRDGRDMNVNDSDPDNDRDHTELGDDVEYVNISVNYNTPYFYTYGYYYNYKFGRTLNHIIETIKDGNNVYFHCVWGADRTGTVAMLIEGLCGVSESDINKDYELTSFYSYRDRSHSYWITNLNHIKGLQGATLRDKFETYCKRIGVTADNIAALREAMIE